MHPQSPNRRIAERFRIAPSCLVAWSKVKHLIFQNVKTRRRGAHTLKECERRAKYALMEIALFAEFQSAREEGRRIGPRWLIKNARRLLKQLMPEKVDITKINSNWLSRFARRYNLAPRRKTNKKRLAVEERVPFLQRYFAMTRLRFQQDGKDNQRFDRKWGIYKRENRYNVDQVPAGIHDPSTTYERKGAVRVLIKSNNDSDDKRFCTLQVLCRNIAYRQGRARGGQPKLGMTFRGTGIRISAEERQSYHPDVIVRFQKKAWADSSTRMLGRKRIFVDIY